MPQTRGPDEPQGGILLRQTDFAQPLIAHFLEHGTLESAVAVHIPKMCLTAGTKPVRFGEKKLGDRSRLSLGRTDGVTMRAHLKLECDGRPRMALVQVFFPDKSEAAQVSMVDRLIT